MAVFVPIFGPLLAGAAEAMNMMELQNSKPVDLETLALGENILWVTLKSFDENRDIVPLEEAILINDVNVRRKYMLETLYSDPMKFLDVLNIAKYNEDVETSHYATTTISKAQKDLQLSIQKLAVAVENDPGDKALIDKYVESLEQYIESGLLEEHLLRNMRIVFSKALERQLAATDQPQDVLIKMLKNSIKLGEFNAAYEIADRLAQEWPLDERSWISYIRACVDSVDRKRLEEVLSRMPAEIQWTREGRESLKYWLS
ncbi:hypothetical protein FBQ83_07400 [Chloroflexi bacterium CFX5]|nr:hypothetical protein [Chloroflexi bacterium CFX5]NUQ58378.1 hypothetical protein [Anaerolineales bacterium]